MSKLACIQQAIYMLTTVSRYILLDKQHIDFANAAINRPDMKG